MSEPACPPNYATRDEREMIVTLTICRHHVVYCNFTERQGFLARPRSRREKGENLWQLRLKLRHSSWIDTHALYTKRTKPIHLRRRIPSIRPSFLLAPGVVGWGFVLEQKSDKYAAICRRMEAKCTILVPLPLPWCNFHRGPGNLTHPPPFPLSYSPVLS